MVVHSGRLRDIHPAIIGSCNRIKGSGQGRFHHEDNKASESREAMESILRDFTAPDSTVLI